MGRHGGWTCRRAHHGFRLGVDCFGLHQTCACRAKGYFYNLSFSKIRKSHLFYSSRDKRLFTNDDASEDYSISRHDRSDLNPSILRTPLGNSFKTAPDRRHKLLLNVRIVGDAPFF